MTEYTIESFTYTISYQSPSRWNIYKKHTVQELDTIHPHINWTDFLNWNLHNIHHVDKNETVVLADANNFVDYFKIIMDKTPKRTIANYLAWRFVSMNTDYLNSDLRGDLYGADPLSVQCVEEIQKLYVNEKTNPCLNY